MRSCRCCLLRILRPMRRPASVLRRPRGLGGLLCQRPRSFLLALGIKKGPLGSLDCLFSVFLSEWPGLFAPAQWVSGSGVAENFTPANLHAAAIFVQCAVFVQRGPCVIFGCEMSLDPHFC